MMIRKIALALSLCLVIFSAFCAGYSSVKVNASDGFPVRNLDTGLSYGTIQEAIDASETSNGHTIFVNAGTYYGNVVVNKAISLVGEDKNRTIVDGNKSLTVILIASDGVSVSGFTARNSYGEQGSGGGGLVVAGVGNIQISDIIAFDNAADWGVHLTPNSHDINITRAIIVDNNEGLLLNQVWNVNVSNSTIVNNTGPGIGLFSGGNNSICGNNITGNREGIRCVNSSVVQIHWNDIFGNSNFNIEADSLSKTVDAIYNYWGKDPNRKIYGNVSHNPWLTESVFPFALAITNPPDGITVGFSLVVELQIWPLASISRIEFYIEGALVHTTQNPPYEWIWDTTKHSNGLYTILVKAYDDTGNVKTSQATITVKNPEPPWWQIHFWTIIEVSVAVGSLILGIVTFLAAKTRKKRSKGTADGRLSQFGPSVPKVSLG